MAGRRIFPVGLRLCSQAFSPGQVLSFTAPLARFRLFFPGDSQLSPFSVFPFPVRASLVTVLPQEKGRSGCPRGRGNARLLRPRRLLKGGVSERGVCPDEGRLHPAFCSRLRRNRREPTLLSAKEMPGAEQKPRKRRHLFCLLPSSWVTCCSEWAPDVS